MYNRKEVERKNNKIEATINSNKNRKAPAIVDMSPDASGRDFLTGCLRSTAISNQSFNKYVAEAQQQNAKNATTVCSQTFKSN